jgi:hypothetical protein
VRQDVGPDASNNEITEMVLKAIEALPESDRAEMLEQLVKRASSRQLAHLDEEVETRTDREIPREE